MLNLYGRQESALYKIQKKIYSVEECCQENFDNFETYFLS